MIMRIFQVSTHPGKEAEFAEFFHKTAIPMMQSTPGLLQLLPGTPHGDHPTEFSMVMVWDSLESLKAFVGEDYTEAHIDPSERDLVRFRRISHYELADA
ncbi:antibiotic biosynthesis monooxygenase family protein [Tropicimonas marinistellae]|uniref:antibiotic biosynthesis monooxygenase family protein n=1 Tax=Tropicimonas marinistellae TaxID=1739787 RepID=UPI00083657BE|nr:antibiotic biosynthesis monooxygenase [Tropicimonas marinistellae]